MTLSKKDYEAIAKILRHNAPEYPAWDYDDGGYAGYRWRLTACSFAEYFKQTNPRFDIDEFMDASGVAADEYRIIRSGVGPLGEDQWSVESALGKEQHGS